MVSKTFIYLKDMCVHVCVRERGSEREREIETETERQEANQALTELKFLCPKKHKEIRKMVLGQIYSSFHIPDVWRQMNSCRRNYLLLLYYYQRSEASLQHASWKNICTHTHLKFA